MKHQDTEKDTVMQKEDNAESKRNRVRKKFKKIIDVKKVVLVLVLLTFLFSSILGAYRSAAPATSDMIYTDFIGLLEDGKIEKMTIVDSSNTVTIWVRQEDGAVEPFQMVPPKYDEFRRDVMMAGVEVEIARDTLYGVMLNTLSTLPLLILMVFIMYYILRMVAQTQTSIFKLFKPEEIITFDDIAGMTETKEQVKFAVDTIKNRKLLKEVGARPTKGIIFWGPPGNGKTMLAKAIAGEAGVPFISTSGSDFIEMFVGLGAARVRSLWNIAIMNAPCVVFIDEIDAVGMRRSESGSDSARESNQTLNALLQKIDGLEPSLGILVIAATNMVDTLDSALVRPGRFDKHLYVGLPNTKEDREAIVKLYLDKKKAESDVTVEAASKLLFGMSGADIETALNEAVILSLRRGKDKQGVISLENIDEAVMGLRLKGTVGKYASEKERKISAIHESGHAIISAILGKTVSKVSIMPYDSGIGGVTIAHYDFQEAKKLYSKGELKGEIQTLVAGYVAEELLLGETHTGVSNDFERASVIAYEMVNSYGFVKDNYLNKEILRKNGNHLIDASDKMVLANTIIEEAIESVRRQLREPNNRVKLEELVQRLLEEETVIDYSL